MSKTILIMAGGTGGHIFPALAVAKKLKKPTINLHWLGSNNGMENELIPQYNIPLHSVNAVGLRGKNIVDLIKAPFLLSIALFQTMRVFFTIKPDVVLGMGGFTSGIGGVIAWLLGIPLVIHEQNAIIGTTNKLLSKIATTSFQAFDGTFNLPNVVTSGNPILFKTKTAKTLKNKPLNLLVLGGSLGAQSINKIMPKLKTNCNIWHQTGVRHFDSVKLDYKKKPFKISAFIEDMADAYAWADVVICRAGAMTISELIATRSVAILIPFPYAINNHQSFNAKILSQKSAAILLPQTKLSVKKMDDILAEIDLKKMRIAIKKFKKLNSGKLISDCLLDLI